MTETPQAQTPAELEVSVERVTDIERKLAVEIPWDRVRGKLDEAYQELGKGVTIKGFRRGKVPRGMLRKMFGEHVNQEVAQQLVQESIAQAVADNDLSPVSEPQVDQKGIVDGEAFCYSAVLQVVPIEPKDYFGVDVTQRPAKVSDDELEQALKRKQQEATEYKPIEGRPTQQGDVLLVEVLGKVDDEPLSLDGELVELADPPREPLAGLAAALTGISVEEKELELELELPPEPPADDDEAPGRTRQARLLVTIKDVKQKVVPALDDEFAKDTGEAETLAELEDKLRKQLLEADEQRARDEAKETLTGLILERNEVPVVPALVERQLEQMMQFQQMLFGGQGGVPEELKEGLRPDAEKTVRSALLMRAISKKEKVEVQEADVEKRLAQMASARGQNIAKVRSEYEQEGRLEQLKGALREEKTLDLLLSKSNLIVQETADSAAPAAATDATEEGAD